MTSSDSVLDLLLQICSLAVQKIWDVPACSRPEGITQLPTQTSGLVRICLVLSRPVWTYDLLCFCSSNY